MRFLVGLGLLVAMGACGAPGAEEAEDAEAGVKEVVGRWDVTVSGGDVSYPSWFELAHQDGSWSGSFVGRFGSARPIPEIELADGKLVFSLPSQYEQGQTELRFEGAATRSG